MIIWVIFPLKVLPEGTLPKSIWPNMSYDKKKIPSITFIKDIKTIGMHSALHAC